MSITLLSRGMVALLLAALGTMLLAAPPAAGAEADLELRSVTRADKDGLAGRDTCSFGNAIRSTGDSYGAACFNTDGDRVFVRDNAPDGYRVGAHWRFTNGNRRGLCVNANGSSAEPGGTQDDLIDAYTVTVRWNCNHNFPEGDWVEWRVARCNASAKDCTVLSNWQNWGAWVRTRA